MPSDADAAIAGTGRTAGAEPRREMVDRLPGVLYIPGVLPSPPYALAPVVFRFRALTALAGRLPLGGEREVVMALLVGARLADGCTTREALPSELRAVRGQGARHWLGTLTLPAATRSAAQQVADASGGKSREGVASALDRLVSIATPALDAPSRAELKQLLARLRAP